MPITISITETDYFLPEDGTVAQAKLLQLLSNTKECYMSAYAFTLKPMIDAITKADAAGAVFHLLLDYSQEQDSEEKPLVLALAASFKKNGHSTITITTAGLNSPQSDDIWHWKGFVVVNSDGTYTCWEGSTNFSDSAWFQGNSCRVFQSSDWANQFIQQFQAHEAWARSNEPSYQVM